MLTANPGRGVPCPLSRHTLAPAGRHCRHGPDVYADDILNYNQMNTVVSESRSMGVTATCTECLDEHPLGDRKRVPGTTACPSCGSKSYSSESNGRGRVTKSEDDRIRDAISDVSGVGEETLERIVAQYSLYAELEQATADELTGVKNVGRTTAERITEAV